MKHLTQKELSRLVADLEDNADALIKWQKHLTSCDFCSSRIEEALAFEANLNNFLNAPPLLSKKHLLKRSVAQVRTPMWPIRYYRRSVYPTAPSSYTPLRAYPCIMSSVNIIMSVV